MTIPRATYNRSGNVDIRFPYDAGLVELLKSEIPFKMELDDFLVSGRVDNLILVIRRIVLRILYALFVIPDF